MLCSMRFYRIGVMSTSMSLRSSENKNPDTSPFPVSPANGDIASPKK